MSDTPQNDPLLTAFLDGELHQEQRESVEKKIANDPSLQALLQQWTEQGNAIRSFPKYRLGGDLSQSVLSEISRRRMAGERITTSNASPSESRLLKTSLDSAARNNWRTPLIAISSLASLILIGFFLLRPDSAQQPQLANRLDSPSATKQIVPGTNEEKSSGEVRSDKLITSRTQLDSELGFATAESSSPVPDANALTARSILPLDAPAASPESQQPLVENAPGGAAGSGRDFAGRDFAGNESSSKNVPSLDLGRMQLSAEPPSVPAAEAEAQQLRSENHSRKPVSIPQVYFVEFSSKEQPLAVVSEIFSRNQIELQLPEGLDSDSPAAPNEMLKTLASRSNHGLEAIYVVATRSQLSRAMAELSDSANISGFEVASTMLSKMLAPPPDEIEEQIDPSEQRMEDLIAQSQSNAGSLLLKEKLNKNENRKLARQPQGGATPVRAMAQQLQPYERKQRPSLEPKIVDTEEQTDPLDQLMQSKTMELNWNYSHSIAKTAEGSVNVADGQAAPRGFAPQPATEQPLASEEGEEELVQFLLLVRTIRPEQ